jgi:hypothetical protein
MDEYNYWVNLYSIIFSVLIASLSLNSITLIKDKFNKILAFFVFAGIYSSVLSYFFIYASIGYMENDFLSKFIYKGYSSNLFFGVFLPLISVLSTITLLVRILIRIKMKSV